MRAAGPRAPTPCALHGCQHSRPHSATAAAMGRARRRGAGGSRPRPRRSESPRLGSPSIPGPGSPCEQAPGPGGRARRWLRRGPAPPRRPRRLRRESRAAGARCVRVLRTADRRDRRDVTAATRELGAPSRAESRRVTARRTSREPLPANRAEARAPDARVPHATRGNEATSIPWGFGPFGPARARRAAAPRQARWMVAEPPARNSVPLRSSVRVRGSVGAEPGAYPSHGAARGVTDRAGSFSPARPYLGEPSGWPGQGISWAQKLAASPARWCDRRRDSEAHARGPRRGVRIRRSAPRPPAAVRPDDCGGSPPPLSGQPSVHAQRIAGGPGQPPPPPGPEPRVHPDSTGGEPHWPRTPQPLQHGEPTRAPRNHTSSPSSAQQSAGAAQNWSPGPPPRPPRSAATAPAVGPSRPD